MPSNDALTADEVAGILQVSKNTVYNLVKRDELASYHIGRKMRFTMGDVENYIARSKRTAPAVGRRSAVKPRRADSSRAVSKPVEVADSLRPSPAPSGEYVIAGNDVIGDVIANYLGATDSPVNRVYEGSYAALVDLYLGRAHAALVHLYDEATRSYNVEAVSRLMPGLPVKLVRLVGRRQGLIVARGNPKNLRTWEDLLHPGVRLVNRERGCGSRILLDEALSSLGADRSKLAGYDREANSALSMASFVARGAADVGIGAERVFHQVEGVDFLPLQDEWLDIALAKGPGAERVAGTVAKLVRTRPFREEIATIVGYDVSRMGEVVYER